MDSPKPQHDKERRRHARNLVRQPATLESSRHGEIQVLVQNFCLGGLYASLLEQTPVADDTVARKLKPDDTIVVRLEFPDATPLRAAAKIARIDELGIGIAFGQPQKTVADKLQVIATRQGFTNAQGHNQGLDESTKRNLTTELTKIAIAFVQARMDETIESSKDDLLLAASKAPSNIGQSPFFEAMSLLRKQGKALRSKVVETVTEHFQTFAVLDLVAGAESIHQQPEELALVDEQEFENFLALSDVITTAEGRNRQELHALEARLSALRGSRVNRLSNPIGPSALCHHYHAAIVELQFSHPAQQVLWRTYGRTLTTHLAGVYRALNRALIEAGVLPNLKFTPSAPKRRPGETSAAALRSAGPSAPPADTPDYHPVGSDFGDPSQATPTVTEEALWSPVNMATDYSRSSATPGATILDIRRLLQQRDQVTARSTGATGTGVKGQATAYQLDELNQALIDLQDTAQEQETPLADRVDHALKDRFGKRSRRQVSDRHAEAIYLAQDLLGAIKADDVINHRAKAWIQQLEMQVLRMLLENDALLSDKNHPARRVINLLGHTVVGDGQELGPRERDLVESIDQLVSKLAKMDRPDERAFQEASDTLSELLKRQQRLCDTHVKRVLETCDGQQRLDEARRKVRKAIDDRFHGKRVSSLLKQLLELGWQQLLDVVAVRSGVDNEQWRATFEPVSRIEELLAEGRAPKASDKAESNKLLALIDERLQHSSAEPDKRERLLNKLRATLPGLSDKITTAVERTAYQPLEPAPPTDEAAADTDPEQAHWLGRAKLLEEGSWLLHRADDGHMQPIKLAWVSDSRDQYVFVDRGGNKVLDVKPECLARKLKADEADVIDQPNQPLVERSWHSMMQHMHEQIAHQATHDQLTDGLNRKEFERQIRLKLGESKLMHSRHIALQIDVDQFQVINSTAGHEAGDQLLKDLGAIIHGELPQDAFWARMGGDEYAVLVPRCELGPGHEIAEKIRRNIAEHRTRWKRRKLKSTASIGLVVIERTSESVSQVLNQMASACSAAKDAGRDRIKSYQIDDRELSQRDRAIRWVTEVEVALDSGRIELFGQRILPLSADADTREHYEILSRMRDQNGEIILPQEFIPAAEAYGRIHYLDEWVFRRAFEMLARSPVSERIACLSLNISGKTFSRPRFLPFVHQLFSETGIEPSKICFEITETAAISNLSRCTDFLRELRLLGCRFSLDDFGTGLSSFNYLKHLPVDYLKIDGSFIKDVANSTADFGLVKTINEIGHFLGKETVAEFVESEEILEHLREIGLDFVQGFGVERPRSLAEILETE